MWGFVLCGFVLVFVLPALISDRVFRTMAKPPFSAQYSYEHYEGRYPRRECRFSSCRRSLCGYFYGEATATDKGLILVVPGAGCPADGHLLEISYFVDRGWQVFSYDATSLGKSEGRSVRGLPQAVSDLRAAICYLHGIFPDSFVIYAHSAGAYAACRLLSSPFVRAAVCIAGFDRPLDVMLYHARLHAGALALLGCPALFLRDFLLFGRAGNRSALRAINRVDTPLLLCQDENDRVVPFAASLAGKKEKIKNKNARIAGLSSGHSGAWLSERAEAYADSVENDYKTLKRHYREKLPKEVEVCFLSSIDRARASEPNAAFLDGVLDFFATCSAK